MHSVDMAINNYFSHTSLQGTSSWDRVRALDPTFKLVGENISEISSDIFVAHEGWIHSYGHRLNMIEADYRYFGFGSAIGKGEYTRYYTVNLGSTETIYAK